MKSVFITGLNGFIGTHLARRLKGRGWTVLGADVQPQGSREICDRYVQLDVSTPEACQKIQALPPVDYVVHGGGISGFMVEKDNPRRIFDVNIAGTMPLIELARRGGCQRIVLCSTIMVYGPQQDGSAELDEAMYPVPISVYGASKVAIEALMHGYHGQYGVDGIALRFSHVYGPGRTTECFIREMLSAVAERRACVIPQAGRALRQYVHVDDVCDAIESALVVASPTRRVFNISADEMHTLAEVADTVRRTIGPLDVRFNDANDLPNYRIPKLSTTAARDVLHYRPHYDLASGLRHYWEYSFRQTG